MLKWNALAPSTRRALPFNWYYSHLLSRIGNRVRESSTAPKPSYDISHIRKHPELHAKNCLARKYQAQSENPLKIIKLWADLVQSQKNALEWRVQRNALQKELSSAVNGFTGSEPGAGQTIQQEKGTLLPQGQWLKEKLAAVEFQEQQLMKEVETLAAELPNLTSEETPIGRDSDVIGYIMDRPELLLEGIIPAGRSHVDIGMELDLLDFAGAATTSGWGWYYLKNEAALLEQALVQYALKVAMEHGFSVVTPPSMVYSHILSACGFQPRDKSGEQQVYNVQNVHKEQGREKPDRSLAGTAEIPFAGMKAKGKINSADLPMKVVGPSRCYRAEAGARGVDTKGLYRVHEFTKVEMFAWTLPGAEEEAFNSILSVQKTVLRNLGLYCRILEMPSEDLGASATRKQDIEASFPSRRRNGDAGWGEVTSASICTDYQTRRLDTRIEKAPGSEEKMKFPYTVNGTAMAVPRVLAALLENGWDEKGFVRIPEVLWPWMHGMRTIEKKN